MNEPILIRDNRRKNFFTIDNVILDRYPSVGPYGLLVYMALARFADNESQACRTSLETIGKRVRISRSSACRGVAELEKSGLISIVRVKDKPSIYTLLPVSIGTTTPCPIETDPFLLDPYNNTVKNKTENRVGPDPNLMKGVVRSVFEHYINVFSRHPKLYTLTETRMQKGLARLQDCLGKTGGNLINAEQMMVIAVDNLALSKWHNGTDPRSTGRYIDWVANLFKSTDELEKWLNFEEKA